MSLRMFFYWVLLKFMPIRRQKLKETLLKELETAVLHTIQVGAAMSVPLTLDDIKNITVDIASRSFSGLMRVTGVSKAELTDVITKVCSAGNKEVG